MTAAVYQGVMLNTMDTDIWVDLPTRQYPRLWNIIRSQGGAALSQTLYVLEDGKVINFLFEVTGFKSSEKTGGREMKWLPDMDLNHDKQIQSLLCYRYTIGQGGAFVKLEGFATQSSWQSAGAIGNFSVYATPHPGPLPRGEGETAPALDENQACWFANAFHATGKTQLVS